MESLIGTNLNQGKNYLLYKYRVMPPTYSQTGAVIFERFLLDTQFGIEVRTRRWNSGNFQRPENPIGIPEINVEEMSTILTGKK